MSLSVALCTHNGARFLEAQLASIAAQDRLPDELVICDDCSSDATPALIERFAAAAPFPVRFSVNRERLGSTGNFSQAIGICTGDVIVLADQDDVWKPHKITTLGRALEDSPKAGFAFSNANIVDEDLRPIGYTLWDAIRFSRRERRRMRNGKIYDVLLKHYVVTGATMAFRAVHKPLVLPIPAVWVHDAWIATMIGAFDGAVLIPEPLIDYRQHAGQQFGERKRSLFEQYRVARSMTQSSYRTVVEAYSLAAERLRKKSPAEIRPEIMDSLDRKVSHFQVRTRMRDPETSRLPMIAREILNGGYRRYSLGWKSIAQDLFL